MKGVRAALEVVAWFPRSNGCMHYAFGPSLGGQVIPEEWQEQEAGKNTALLRRPLENEAYTSDQKVVKSFMSVVQSQVLHIEKWPAM
jgi:hypothetical protein